MAIKQLTEEQVQDWTLEQKDQWWLENVYRGNMRQLTLRSGLTGAFLGSILGITNLYVAIKTGWTLGVGITSVILSFTIFKFLSRFNVGEEMTILENNAMQSIATSAGYMTAPLTSSIAAYMMISGHIIPQWQVYFWIVCLGLLGALFAFPLKKKYINDEQLPFPEGYAAGMVLNNLHQSGGEDGIFKAKLLGGGALMSGLIEFFRSQTVLNKLGLKFMTLPSHWESWIYKWWTPQISGYSWRDLTIGMETSIVMMGTGMLMSLRSTGSMMLGAITCYVFLAPWAMDQGIVVGGGFRNITLWALWGGVSMMTTSSLFSFAMSKGTFSGLADFFKKKKQEKKSQRDALSHIELPLKVSFIGVPILSLLIMYMGKSWFGIDYWLSVFAIPFVFILSIMAIKSTGLTAITPGGALSKLTQLANSILAPGNVTTNIMTAGITSEVCLSASNLLMDIKPAYMLGGKPRHQAVGHIIGIFCGSLVAVPMFYLLFDTGNGLDVRLFGTERFPMPGVTVWKAVADILSKGLSSLHPTAQWAVLIGGTLGIAFEYAQIKTKGKFFIMPVAFGIAFIIPFHTSLEFFVGSFIFWLMSQKQVEKRSVLYSKILENKETIGAGIIAGGALVGICLMIVESI